MLFWERKCLQHLTDFNEKLNFTYWQEKWWALAKALTELKPTELLVLHYEQDKEIKRAGRFFHWLFDFVLKRRLRWFDEGRETRFAPQVFETARVFSA